MIKQRAGYKASLTEYKALLVRKDNLILFQEQERMIHHLEKVIGRLDYEIKTIIDQDEQLNHHNIGSLHLSKVLVRFWRLTFL
jgi:hypothetical protein